MLRWCYDLVIVIFRDSVWYKEIFMGFRLTWDGLMMVNIVNQLDIWPSIALGVIKGSF